MNIKALSVFLRVLEWQVFKITTSCMLALIEYRFLWLNWIWLKRDWYIKALIWRLLLSIHVFLGWTSSYKGIFSLGRREKWKKFCYNFDKFCLLERYSVNRVSVAFCEDDSIKGADLLSIRKKLRSDNHIFLQWSSKTMTRILRPIKWTISNDGVR